MSQADRKSKRTDRNGANANDGSEASTKRISSIATIVVAVLLALLTIIGWIFKNSFTPQVIDAAFGISDHVFERMARNIDSGYSEWFQINSTPNRKYAATFYAKKGQTVYLTVTGHALQNLSISPVPVQIYVDKIHWTTIYIPDPDSSFRYNGDVSDRLNFSDPTFQDIHDIRLVPQGLGPSDEVFVRTLVLVSNLPKKDE